MLIFANTLPSFSRTNGAGLSSVVLSTCPKAKVPKFTSSVVKLKLTNELIVMFLISDNAPKEVSPQYELSIALTLKLY